MEINMTAKEIADTIAEAVTETTGHRCEAFAGDHGDAVVVSDRTRLIARVAPDRDLIQVVAAPSDPDAVATGIPSRATSIDGMRGIAARCDDAIARVMAAAR